MSRRIRSAASRGLFVFFGTACAWLAFGSEASAVGRFDNLTGIDQSFTLGNEYRAYSEENRDASVYELTVPDEEKEKTAIKERDDEVRRYDRWSYQRSAGYNLTYDANINNTRLAPKDDLIHNETLTLGMSRKAKTNFVELFYNGSYSHQQENEKAATLTHNQLTHAGYTLGRLTLDFTNTYSPAKVFETGDRTELQATPENTRGTSTNNNAQISLNYAVSPKTNVGLGYSHALFYLPTSSNSAALNTGFSQMTHVIRGGASYRVTPKLIAFTEYSWAYRDYYRGGIFDSYGETVAMRLQGRISPKTRVNLALGIYNRRYLDRPVDPREGTTWAASISQRLTPKIVGTLSAVRTASENLSSDSFTRDGRIYGVDFTWKLRPKLTLDFGADMGFYSTGDILRMADADNPAIFFTRPDEDEQFAYYVSLKWAPKPNLTALMGYQYLNQNGSFKDSEFEDHKMVGSVQARF